MKKFSICISSLSVPTTKRFRRENPITNVKTFNFFVPVALFFDSLRCHTRIRRNYSTLQLIFFPRRVIFCNVCCTLRLSIGLISFSRFSFFLFTYTYLPTYLAYTFFVHSSRINLSVMAKRDFYFSFLLFQLE